MTGNYKPCLHSKDEINLKGLSGEELEEVFKRGILINLKNIILKKVKVKAQEIWIKLEVKMEEKVLTHINEQGRAKMVDVGEKEKTKRIAKALQK